MVIEKHCDFQAGVTIIAAEGPGPSLLLEGSRKEVLLGAGFGEDVQV